MVIIINQLVLGTYCVPDTMLRTLMNYLIVTVIRQELLLSLLSA